MVKRVALVGPDKGFFAAVKKNLLSFYPDVCWLEFDNGFDIILHCLTQKELPEIVFTEMMFISKKTVDNLFNSVARKVGVQNRHNLTLFCIRTRLAKFSTVKTSSVQTITYH